jgi:hypothetical protein
MRSRFHRRIGLLLIEHAIERLADVLHRRRIEGSLAIHGREPGRAQQHVALAQRQVERIAQHQRHLATGLRATGLEEAQVPRRDLGLLGERLLGQPSSEPPLAEQRAEAAGMGELCHPARVNRGSVGRTLPTR